MRVEKVGELVNTRNIQMAVLTFLAGLALVFAISTTAPAMGIATEGPGNVTNSWTQSLSCTTCNTFDTLEVFIVADTGGGPFQNSGMFNFNDPSWSGSLINPNYALATGNALNTLSWVFDFDGNGADYVTLNLLLWNGGVFSDLVFAASFDLALGWAANIQQAWNGPYDFLAYPDGKGYNRAAVPEPSTLLLLGSGLAGLGFVRRRLKG